MVVHDLIRAAALGVEKLLFLKKDLVSDIEIDTSPEKVWSVLTDFTRFPDWNPFMRWIRGELREGARLEVHLQPAGARGTTFKPTVLSIDPPRELRWIGRLGMGGLFDGEHALTITFIGENKVRIEQKEVFTGLFLRHLAKSLDGDMLRGFNEMNKALNENVEKIGD
jgi:hypothetical protein